MQLISAPYGVGWGSRYRLTVRAFDYVYAEANTEEGGRDTVNVWATAEDDLITLNRDVLEILVIQSGVPWLVGKTKGFETVKLQPTTGSNDRVRIIPPVDMEYTIGSGWIVE